MLPAGKQTGDGLSRAYRQVSATPHWARFDSRSQSDRSNTDWRDEDKVRRFVFEEMPEKLRADEKVKNALEQGDPQNARIEVDRAVRRLVLEYMMDHTQLYKEFTSREDFRSFVVDKLFGLLSQEKSS